jgi:hypothetical protein
MAVVTKLTTLSRGGFKRCIGGRYFYWPASLGVTEARRQAALLKLAWGRLQRDGCPWTEAAVDVALGVGGSALPTNRARANDRRDRERRDRERLEREARDRRERDTLHGGLDDYVVHLGGREVSQAYKSRGRAALVMVKRVAPDVPLYGFDLVRLGELVDGLNGAKHGGDYAAATIRTTLHFLKDALTYLDTRGRWELTLRSLRLLKPRRERVTPTVDVFTDDEVVALLAASSPLVRACILLGLNCGFTSSELSSLTNDHLVLEDGGRGARWKIEKSRTKTGRPGAWTLWPETVKAMEAAGWKPGTEGLVLKTSAGTALCHYCPAGERADALGRAWHRLAKLLPEGRRLGHKHMRKTGATWVSSVAGEVVAGRYLAHTGGSVARRHYLGDDDRADVSAALEAVRTAKLKTISGA